MRETVLELEDQIHQLNKHKDDLQRDLNEEKRANEKVSYYSFSNGTFPNNLENFYIWKVHFKESN